MNIENAIAQRHHIFINDFLLTPISLQREISPNATLYEAINNTTNKKYLLLKSTSTFATDEQKYIFIRHAERATELIHPTLFPLSGFSDSNPDLYFEFYPGLYSPISDSQLQNLDTTSIKMIILGIISGISYLLSKGFSIANLSLDSIFFDIKSGPKFINYINTDAIDNNSDPNNLVEKCDEKQIIYQIGQITRELFCHRRKQSEQDEMRLPDGLNPILNQYITCCNNMNDDSPTLSDLFNSLKALFKSDPLIQKYLVKLDSADKFRYNYQMDQGSYVPFKILKDQKGFYYSNVFFDNNVNILHSCFIQNDVFRHKEYFPLLNRLPDSEIKLLLKHQKNPPKQFYEFLCYEEEHLLLPEFKKYFYSNKPEDDFFIYKKLIEKSKEEEEPNKAIYPIALKHLKSAAKANHKNAKIKLGIHYLKGDIVPANFEKSLLWLKSASEENHVDVSRYTNPIVEKMKEIDDAIANLGQHQKEAIKFAEDGKPLYMLYVAFAFYSGIDNFPIFPSKSVYYYRLLAKKTASCMCLLGGMYLLGCIFPRNLIRARNCFEKAALNGSMKAKILDSLMRKHMWRYYLSDVNIESIYKSYMQCPESLSFDDTLIFPEINYLIENQQNYLIHSAPYMSSFYFYDRRNELNGIIKKNEIKLAIKTIDFRVPTVSDKGLNTGDVKIAQLYSYLHVVNKLLSSNILPQQLNPLFYKEKENFLISFTKNLLDKTFGFIYAEDNNDDNNETDITKHNMEKFNISSDMESKLLSPIQNKYIPADIKEKEFNTSTVSYIPQLSLPVAETTLKEVKTIIDRAFEEVLPEILKRDKDKYFVAHVNAPNNSIQNYFENIENALKITIQKHMPESQFLQDFINQINSSDIYYSEPILYSSKIENDNEEDIKTQMYIAESYFNGQNGFPVNYTEAAKHYKMAADKGNVEAEWKYAKLNINGLGTLQDGKTAYNFLKKSAEEKDSNGMLLYGLFIRHFLINHGTKENVKWPSFQKYIEESANTGNLEAINQLAMILESNYCYEEGTAKSVAKYEDAVEKGRIDSIFRIIHIYDNPKDKKKYKQLVKLSIGMCDHDIMMRMIHINNHKKKYDQSKRLIKVGLCFDRDAFLPNYAKHFVLNSNEGNIHDRIAFAKSLLTPTLTHPSSLIIRKGYLENYLMAMLTILSKANDYEEACQLFLKNRDCLTLKSKKEFIDFYMHINKNVARQYQLSINSYLPEYRACVDAFLLIKQKGAYVKMGNDKLKVILQENSSNQFALLKRGKILLKNHLYMRRNITKAFDFIQAAAKQNCPEARFVYGKELYYGRTIPMDRWKAFKYFKKAFDKTNQDPRAGYFLSKKCYIQRNLIKKEEADDCLRVAVRSGYRRALFKLGKRFFYSKGNKSELGIILIKKARDQHYYKSIDFLDKYENELSEDAIQENEQKAYFAFAKELYLGRIIAQDLKMSFSLFMKFFMSNDPDLRAGYYLSKKKYIQMELISPQEARNALVISAKSHYKCALFRLGKLYYTREGKKEKGILLMKKAKKLNYKKAIDFLERIKAKDPKLEHDQREITAIIPSKQMQIQNEDDHLDTDSMDYLVKKSNNNNNDIVVIPNEIKVNDGSSINPNSLTPIHKSVTSSNFDLNKMNIPLKLKHTLSNKTSEFNEPLLSDFNQDSDEKKEITKTSANNEENQYKQKRINLRVEITSDFSDEPEDDTQ